MIAPPSPNQTEYCRILDGKIVEYPVYLIHIQNRAHPVELYTPVTHANAPVLPEFGYYTKSIALTENGTPLVTYEVKNKTLNMVLRDTYQNRQGTALLPGTEAQGVFIKDIPDAVVQFIYRSAENLAQSYLDKWATERGYKDLDRLVGYATSKTPERAAEAQRGVDNRDQVWDTLFDYWYKISNNQIALPRSEEEIVALFPKLTWA